jgi:hypothetical protein
MRFEQPCRRRASLLAYAGAPSTDYKIYKKAQEALTKMEDMTFADDEFDACLPKESRRKQ